MEDLETNMRSDATGLSGKELYELRRKERARGNKEKYKQEKGMQRKEKLSQAPKKIGTYSLYVLIIVGIIFGIRALTRLGSRLPPLSQIGHVEINPPSHILDSPMGEKIQRHMLEHADGTGPPGIIIQYNCDDFDCAPDLINQLTTLAEEYPNNVYLAPNSYDGKIILTKEGRREILDELDEQAIRAFIGGRAVNEADSDTPSLGVPAPGHENMPEMTAGPSGEDQ